MTELCSNLDESLAPDMFEADEPMGSENLGFENYYTILLDSNTRLLN